jgi:hypothetical protein
MANIKPDFKISGISIACPSRHRWEIPRARGADGQGQIRYPAFHSYVLEWGFLTQPEFSNLYNIWLGQYGSGTTSIQLPRWQGSGTANDYTFHIYSGVVMEMPAPQDYNYGNLSGIKVTIRKISVL